MRISMVAAMAANRVIGKDNQLLWRLPEDLKRFKSITMGSPVVMGRKTYESIGRLLPGRTNVILSRDPAFAVEGAKVFTSLDAALAALANEHAEVFVIGGGEIYRQALPRADRLYLTEIDAEYEGDAFFPEFDRTQFREIGSEERSEPFRFRFVTYERA